MHTPVCVCDECKIERHGLVGYLRIVADKQEADWVDTYYEPWLLALGADRIEKLEAGLRAMHRMVHDHIFRSGTPKGFPEGSRTIGPEVLQGINQILRDNLGRSDPSLKDFRFADDPADA